MDANRITIGIFDVYQGLPLNKLFFDPCYYAPVNKLNLNNNRLLRNGDIVEMFVDFDSMELKWKINGIHFKRWKRRNYKIKIHKSQFRAGINLFVPGDSVKLLVD